jgi:peptidoglycan/LPS O-acetylase OafA/YrhL
MLLEASLLAHLPFYRRENQLLDLSRGYSKPLEGIRGVLAFSVLAHHALVAYAYQSDRVWKPPASRFYAQLGMIAVLLFFFTTAYLFWSKLLRSPKLDPLSFYRDRVKRLWPAYLFATGLFFVSVFVISRGHRNTSAISIVGSALSWIAFTLPGQPLLNGVSGDALFSIVWSLRDEWLFYLCLPFLGWFACRKRYGLLCLLAIVVIARVAVATIVTWPATLDHLNFHVLNMLLAIRYFLYLVCFGFSGGLIVAAIEPSPQLVKLARGRAGFILSMISLGVTVRLVGPSYGARETAGLILPFACIAWGNTWCGLLSSSPMRFLGRVSYSAYLLHLIVIYAVYSIMPKSNGKLFLSTWAYCACLGLIGTLVLFLSTFSYRWFEAPFVRPKRTDAHS